MLEIASRGSTAPAARRGSVRSVLRVACWASLLAAPVGLSVPEAHAADYVWIGLGSTSNWSDAGNWFPGQVPIAGSTLHFGRAVPAPLHFDPNSDTPALQSLAGIVFDSADSYTLSGLGFNISAGGILKAAGSGASVITNGIAVLTSQTWSNQAASTLTLNALVNLTANLTVAPGPGDIIFNGAIQGAHSLILDGTGTLRLNGPNAYSLGTVILSGTLQTGASNVIPAGAVTISGGTLDLTGFSETIGSPGLVINNGLVKIGTQLMISTLGNFIVTDSTNIAGSTIQGGPLNLATTSGTRPFAVASAGTPAGELTIHSDITNPGGGVGTNSAIQKLGTGRMVLDGNNTYPRETEIVAGQLRVRSNSALGAGGNGNETFIDVGAALELSGGITVATEELAGFGGTGVGSGALHSVDGDNRWNGAINMTGSTTIGVSSGTLRIGGTVTLTHIAALTKVGSGTLVLEASNGYEGDTHVNAGRLRVANTTGSATGGGPPGQVFIASGATLEGTGIISGQVNVANGGAVAPGASAGKLTIGRLVMDPGATMGMEIGGLTPGTQHDQLAANGPATLNGTLEIRLINGFVPNVGDAFTLMTFTSRTGTFAYVHIPSLPAGRGWAIGYAATALTATVIANTGVDDALPSVDALRAPRPNPARLGTTIPYDLASRAAVSLRIYDVSGRLVAHLVHETLPAGHHQARWDGTDASGRAVPGGTYFARMSVDGRAVGDARAIQRLR
jgi:fibronectin-binding autotransporter adhesin